MTPELITLIRRTAERAVSRISEDTARRLAQLEPSHIPLILSADASARLDEHCFGVLQDEISRLCRLRCNVAA